MLKIAVYHRGGRLTAMKSFNNYGTFYRFLKERVARLESDGRFFDYNLYSLENRQPIGISEMLGYLEKRFRRSYLDSCTQ